MQKKLYKIPKNDIRRYYECWEDRWNLNGGMKHEKKEMRVSGI